MRRAAAISAPLDLGAAGSALDRGLNRLLYTRRFLSILKPKSLAKLERFPDLYDRNKVRAARSFREFDNLVTAPLHGFRDTDHYWASAACAPYRGTGVQHFDTRVAPDDPKLVAAIERLLQAD